MIAEQTLLLDPSALNIFQETLMLLLSYCTVYITEDVMSRILLQITLQSVIQIDDKSTL